MSKGRVKLPPLVLDGEAKVLHRMTLRELHVCLTRALRVAGGDSVEESGRSVFSIMEQPPWWPQELPFDAKFTQKLPPEERSVYYRHLLMACYSFYKQEDTLHLFDSRPGEPPRWRLVQDGDDYTIVNTFTDRPIWTYSTNYQILPLITLAAKQAEQYRAAIGERLKRRNTGNTRDLVIRTRSQKANPARNQGIECAPDADSGDESDDGRRTPNGDHPLSPRSRRLVSPDGSPRRFSIMNRLSLSHRFSFSELFGEQVSSSVVVQPAPEYRCCKCTAGFHRRSELLEHLIKFHQENVAADESADKQRDVSKDMMMFKHWNMVPRRVLSDYEQSIRKHVPKEPPLQKFWKPQFVGCQLPLSSELGRRLFGVDRNQQRKEIKGKHLSYEHRCGTRHLLRKEKNEQPIIDSKSQSDAITENGSSPQDQKKEDKGEETIGEKVDGQIDSVISDGAAAPEKTTTKPKGPEKITPPKETKKFYPVVYRPPRLIYHTHTYKFTIAEHRLFIRMQKNGGLNRNTRKLLKTCVPLTVKMVRLTDEELAAHGIYLDESEDEEESEIGSDESDVSDAASTSHAAKELRSRSHGQMVTRSHNQKSSSAARALVMVRKKYWANNAHLMKRIGGGVLDNQAPIGKRRNRGKRRRSSRGHVPRRRFSLVEEFDGGGERSNQESGSTSLPSSPSKTSWAGRIGNGGRLATGKGKRFSSIWKMSPRARGRPQREHRLPARYRSPQPDENGGSRRKKKKLMQGASATMMSPSKFVVPNSPFKQNVPTIVSQPGRTPLVPASAVSQDVASLVAKILRKDTPDQTSHSAASALSMFKKSPVRPLSHILPKDTRLPLADAAKPESPQRHAPPPYSMFTCEHVYANLGGYYSRNLNAEPPAAAPKGFGRFMTPRSLSPATEERIRETVDEVVETACGDLGQNLPPEIAGLRYYDMNSDDGDFDNDFKIKREQDDDEEEASRCSSESTIVSAIFECPSSPEEDEKEDVKKPISPPPLSQMIQQVEEMTAGGEDVPAAKRLKMSFSEICATPQKQWSRPSILASRKPAILGGRTPVPASYLAAIRGGAAAASGAGQGQTGEEIKQEEASVRESQATPSATDAEKLPSLENVSKPDFADGGVAAEVTVTAKMEKPENVPGGSSVPPVAKNQNPVQTPVSSAATEAPTPQTRPVLIVSSLSSSSAPTQQLPTFSHLVGKTFRVPAGCRLVAIPVKNVSQGAASTSSSSSTGQFVSGAFVGNPPSVATIFRPRTPFAAAAAGGSQQDASAGKTLVRAVTTQVPTIDQVPTASTVVTAAAAPGPPTATVPATTAPTPASAMPLTPQILQNTSSSSTSFKCGFCGVELLFATTKAWQNIQYHMSASHQNRNYKLRRVVRKRQANSLFIEAVSV